MEILNQSTWEGNIKVKHSMIIVKEKKLNKFLDSNVNKMRFSKTIRVTYQQNLVKIM